MLISDEGKGNMIPAERKLILDILLSTNLSITHKQNYYQIEKWNYLTSFTHVALLVEFLICMFLV